MATQAQILDKVVGILCNARTLKKGMQSTLLLSALGRLRFFYLGIVTGLVERKL